MGKPADFQEFPIRPFYALEKEYGNDFANHSIDSQLAVYSHQLLLDKLKIARSKGRRDWWKNESCSIDDLKTLLNEHIAKGQMLDVSVIAMMIHARECSDHIVSETTKENDSEYNEAVIDLLSLVQVDIDINTIESWTYVEKMEAEKWAVQLHLSASDNDVDVPHKPDFIKESQLNIS